MHFGKSWGWSSKAFQKLSHSPPAHCPAAIPPLSWHSFDGTQFPVSPDGALHAPCPHLTNVTSGKTFGSENYVTMIVIWRAVDSRDFLHNSWNEKANILMLCNWWFNSFFNTRNFFGSISAETFQLTSTISRISSVKWIVEAPEHAGQAWNFTWWEGDRCQDREKLYNFLHWAFWVYEFSDFFL